MTRIDVLRTATQQLMDTAAATQTYTSQFRMAIYDFGEVGKHRRICGRCLHCRRP